MNVYLKLQNNAVKGIIHLNIKIFSSFTHLVQTCNVGNHTVFIFGWKFPLIYRNIKYHERLLKS